MKQKFFCYTGVFLLFVSHLFFNSCATKQADIESEISVSDSNVVANNPMNGTPASQSLAKRTSVLT